MPRYACLEDARERVKELQNCIDNIVLEYNKLIEYDKLINKATNILDDIDNDIRQAMEE